MKIFSSTAFLQQYRDFKYFHYKSRFNGIFSRDDLPKIKDGSDVTNLDDKQSKGKHWVSLFTERNEGVYFDSFGTEYSHQEVLTKTKDKPVPHNIFRIQSVDSIMCKFYCIAFIEHMIVEKFLLEQTNLFSPNDFGNNHKITYKYLKDKYAKRKSEP